MHIEDIMEVAYNNAKEKGFWKDAIRNPDGSLHKRDIASRLCLVHSEISEALEAVRDGEYWMYHDKGKPEGMVVELADTIIRICDLARAMDLDLPKAVQAKMVHNSRRPTMHGGRGL